VTEEEDLANRALEGNRGVSREEFLNWLNGLEESRFTAACHAIAEGVYGNDWSDEQWYSELRKHVYDMFPEWHEEGAEK
jgi:hypothetical protein